jgi:hypothetical protein
MMAHGSKLVMLSELVRNGWATAAPEAVNDLLVQAAVALGLEDGAKLRVDTTVVETDIHHPTDNLWDVVPVVSNP